MYTVMLFDDVRAQIQVLSSFDIVQMLFDRSPSHSSSLKDVKDRITTDDNVLDLISHFTVILLLSFNGV